MAVTEGLSKTPVWARQQAGGPPTGTETRSPEEAMGTPLRAGPGDRLCLVSGNRNETQEVAGS